jgi:membrane-associated protease RseP (regulator of RpoE activity)
VIPEADQARAFHRFSAPRRLVVLAAGSVSHMIVAFVLFFVVLTAFGTPKLTTTIGTVAPCLPAAGAAHCTDADPPSPARAAGLRAGDKVLAVGGTPIEHWEQSTSIIRATGAGPLPIRVQRDGQELNLTANLVTRERPDPDHLGRTAMVGVLGVEADLRNVHAGPLAGAKGAASFMGRVTTGSFEALVNIPHKIPNLIASLHGGERDKAGLIGIVGAARISGDTFAAHEVSLSDRVSSILVIIAGLNVFIGLFNVFPLLPLDGGHMAVVSYEGLRRQVFRRLGRPDPGRVDMRKLLPMTYAFLAVLLCLTVLLVAADIVNPVRFS